MTPTSLLRTTGAASLALFYSALTMGAIVAPSPAEARAAAPYYTVELAAPATQSSAVISGVAWNCVDTSCVAAKGNSRPVIMCARVAREFGEVTKFTAKGEDLADDKLAKCNG